MDLGLDCQRLGGGRQLGDLWGRPSRSVVRSEPGLGGETNSRGASSTLCGRRLRAERRRRHHDDLVIRNTGTTIAKDVKVTFAPRLQSTLAKEDGTYDITQASIIRDGIPTLPPGKAHSMLFDSMPQLFGSEPTSCLRGNRLILRSKGSILRPPDVPAGSRHLLRRDECHDLRQPPRRESPDEHREDDEKMDRQF